MRYGDANAKTVERMPLLKTLTGMIPVAFLFATSLGAQDKPVRRLEGVTWSPADHKLTWTVASGKMTDGKFEARERFTYEIDMDAAVMTNSGQDRRFSKQEAVRVHALMDMVAKYAAESTIWWDAGEGEPVDGKSKGKDKSVVKHGQQPEDDEDDTDEAVEEEAPAPKQPRFRVVRIAHERITPKGR